MPPTIVVRRAAQIRDLLVRGVFAGARVPLRNGGTLPAELFAKIALGDLDRLSTFCPSGRGGVSGISWEQLAQDIELLHEVALARGYASAEPGRAPV
jgi:hypothetical protein